MLNLSLFLKFLPQFRGISGRVGRRVILISARLMPMVRMERTMHCLCSAKTWRENGYAICWRCRMRYETAWGCFGFVVPNLIDRCARLDRFFFFFVVTLSDGSDQLMARKPCLCKAASKRENKTSSASVRISAKSRFVRHRLGKVQSEKPHLAQAVADEQLGLLIGQALFKIRILNIKT